MSRASGLSAGLFEWMLLCLIPLSGGNSARAQAPCFGADAYRPAPCLSTSPSLSAPTSLQLPPCAEPWGVGYGAPAPMVAAPAALPPYAAPSCAPAVPPQAYVPASPIVWGGRAGALWIFRDDANHEFFSYDSAVETYQLLDARDAVDDSLPGVEGQIVRFDMCTMRGVEAIYWGLFPSVKTASAYAGDVSGDLNAILNFDQLNYNGGLASAYVNDAVVHRLQCESSFNNVEINRLWGLPTRGGCSPWSARMLVGFRYFDFDETLQFGADTVDTMFTGADEELYYTIDVDNNLYGVQLGGYAEKAHGPWSATFGAKAGVFANDASAMSHIGGAAGTAVINNGPNLNRQWLVSANKCDAAFLAEVRAGVARRLSCHWRATAEYRVLAVSGVALPTNQIFHDLRGLQDVELLATNGDLFLHGAFVGLERVF